MSYVPTVSNTNENKPKDYRKVIYALLIVSLAITWGYIIFDKSKSKEVTEQKEVQIKQVSNAKDSIQKEFNFVSARFDSLMGSNTHLKFYLSQKNQEIQKSKDEISNILKKEDSNEKELVKAVALIKDLRRKIANFESEIDRLKKQNAQLLSENNRLSSSKDSLLDEKKKIDSSLAAVQEQKKHQEDIASTLHASNISVEALDIKKDGKEKVTTTAKKINALKFSFDLDENRIAPSGTKTLYICIFGPDGKLISNGETFSMRDSAQVGLSKQLDVEYEQGVRLPVKFMFKQDKLKYEPGIYKVQIYNNGFKIGEGKVTLKKGGLFG